MNLRRGGVRKGGEGGWEGKWCKYNALVNKISLNQIKVNTERLLNELWFVIQMKFQTISKMTLNKLLPLRVI